MIHHEVHWHERGSMILAFFAEARDGRTHGGQVHEQRHAGKILQNDSRHDERYFLGSESIRFSNWPDSFMLLFSDALAVAIAKHSLQDESQGNGEFRDGADSAFSNAGKE